MWIRSYGRNRNLSYCMLLIFKMLKAKSYGNKKQEHGDYCIMSNGPNNRTLHQITMLLFT